MTEEEHIFLLEKIADLYQKIGNIYTVLDMNFELIKSIRNDIIEIKKRVK